jgi:hypothetical protein
MSRQRNQAAAKKAGGGTSQKDSNAKALSIVCQVCRQSFLCNMTVPKLKEHSDSKHPKVTFADCFPEQAAAAQA